MPRAYAYGVAAILVAGSAWAQLSVNPRTIQLDTLTCQDTLSLSREQRDRLLIYLNGYFDGTKGAKTWDEDVVGERIERAVAECESRPETPLLRVFADAWSR